MSTDMFPDSFIEYVLAAERAKKPMEHKITHGSPYRFSPDKDAYAADSWWQRQLLQHGLDVLVSAPFETNIDLRGRTVTLTLHDDGLHVTAELLPEESK